MIGHLTRGKRTNHVRVDHAVIGAVIRQCRTCERPVDHAVLEPGNLVMCSICHHVSAKVTTSPFGLPE